MNSTTADGGSAEGSQALVPPPGCPAHAGSDAYGPGGLARIYGEAHRTDPMGLFERLRAEHGAVAPVLMEGDLPAWLVLGYRENLEVARSASRFTRDSRLWKSQLDGDVAEDSPLLPLVGWQPLCVFVDGTEHERLRAAVTDGVEGLDRRGMRRHITRFADQLIDAFCADGEADLMADYAEKLPMLVMTQLYGMPEEYGPRLVDATLDLTRATATAFESNEIVVEALRAHVTKLRESPGVDFASSLMQHTAGMTDEEVVQHLRLIMVSAHINITILIGNTLRMMVTDHRFRASLAGARMTLPDALEQILWDEPSTIVCPARWATGDTELAGKSIKAGDMLLLGLAAGNVDPDIRPDLAAPMHGNRSHLAFSGGPHECPGQDIGRAITETAVDVLIGRLPDIMLAIEEKELTWAASWLSRQLISLPVRFTPTAAATQQPRKTDPNTAVAQPAASEPSAERSEDEAAAREPRRPEAEASAAGGALAVGQEAAVVAEPAAPAPTPAPQRASFGARVAGWFGLRRRK
ncbi:cytochrome P450 [Yinghuangia seranimata]|uniref:cytochrome P450 n=1 Tax=Yinghuangia seranimata TaxID=408067 RepID=UPI00248CB693|nr:cytochrome P450 [Yinghuangia seranimata]MDI2130046.1 cytochrome P450 [Yinghuangia seranimata]